MKKIYVVSMAMAVGLSAMAMEKSSTVATMSQADMTVRTYAESTEEAVAGTEAISSIADLEGLYKWNSEGHLKAAGKEGPLQGTILSKQASDNSLLFSGFAWGAQAVEFTVNLDDMVIVTNANQVTGINANENVYFYIYQVTTNSEGKYVKTKVNNARGTIDANGNITFPDDIWFGWSDPANEAENSYFELRSHNKFTRQPFNTPENLDGYTKIGDGKFTDGWFNPVLRLQNIPEIKDVTVACWKNNTNGKVILIENPYADQKWADIKLREGDGKGYIIFDTTLPELVTILPLVDCGMKTDDSEQGQAPGTVITTYYPYNEEGMRVFNGEDPEEILEEYQMGEIPTSAVKGNKVTFLNLFFGLTEAPVGAYWWTKDESERVATVELPEGWNEGGVEGVYVDGTEDVRYYNLQGVEIAAPVKGQLTIKKEGNKAVKFFAR